MQNAYVGSRLRQLREERKLSQVEFAKALAISPSYLNQLERNGRPLTVPVLLKISDVFGVDGSFFAPQDTTRLIAELNEVLLDDSLDVRATPHEITEMAAAQPRIAKAMIALHQRYRRAIEQLGQLSADGSAPLMPHEQVRDFFYSHTYLDELDTPAEQLAAELAATHRDMRGALVARLHEKHGLRVVERPQQSVGVLHRYDPESRVLTMSRHLRPDQQAFRLARQLALIEYHDIMAALADSADLISDEARDLAIIGMANYFAAAVMLPYEKFRTTAEEFRYDIERLADRFETSFETVCHRLSTLQRPRSRGIPFSFVRVDRAGNVSKRLSATPFHFSRTGGTCPLWNVYEAFASPGKILTQIASMPDGHRYLWIARTVTRSPGRYGEPSKTFAIGLGCETRHASRVVYSAGLDLDDQEAATPIGMGCKTCERPACAQRAFPPLGRPLNVDQNSTTFIPYPVASKDERNADRG